MKNVGKRIAAFVLTAVMAVSLAACGKEGEQGAQSGEDTSGYVYVPSFETLNTERADDSGWMNNIRLENDALYYTVNSWDETTQMSSYKICRRGLEAGAAEEVLYSPGSGDAEGGNENLNYFVLLPEGKIALILSQYMENDNLWTLKIVDETGAEIFTEDITAAVKGNSEWTYISHCVSDKEGNLYLQSDSKILVYDINGSFLFELNAKESWIQGIGMAKDGTVLVVQYSGGKTDCSTIDLEKKDYGVSYQGLPQEMDGSGIAPGITKDVLIRSRSGLIEYDFASQTYEEILNWIDSDINPDYVEGVSVTEDGKILALIREWGMESATEYQLCTLTKTLKSEVPQKELITLGTLGLSQGIRNAVVDFNKTNGTYRITIKDYAKNLDYSQENAYADAVARFNNDLMTGNAPDIIDLSYGSGSQYMNKGVIEDLYPYLENSSVVSKEDFIAPVLDAYSVDGKLTCIPSSFYITTLAAKISDVGDRNSWTMAELIETIDSKPADMQIMQYAVKNDILRMSLMFDEESYIDWASGKCNFNSEDFKRVLEFANRFPAEYEFYENEPSQPELIAEGKLLLLPVTISEFKDIQTYGAMYGDDITYIGYPTATGENGSAFSGQDKLGISSKSANKEGAWLFLESLMTEKYQTGMFSWGLPTLKSAYNEKLAKDMEKHYELDEEGNPVLDEEGNKIEVSTGGMSYDNFSIDFYAVSQEEADRIEALIAATNKVVNEGEASEVFNIINEEAAPYFAGQKSLQEVVDIIQSRVQIYISENM